MVLGQVDAPLQQQTINAQLSPGQNRQSSPLITPAYHGLKSLVIAGQERIRGDSHPQEFSMVAGTPLEAIEAAAMQDAFLENA